MADRPAVRLEGRGADGAGGWLASACRLILNVRAGILLITLFSLRRGGAPRAGGRRDPGRQRRLAGPRPALGAGRPDPRPPPVLPGGRARAGRADPDPDRRRQPVLLLHARHRAARRPRLRLPGRGAVLGDADHRLRVRDPPALADRLDAGGLPHARRAAVAVSDRGRRRGGRAAAAGPPGRGRGDARRRRSARWPRRPSASGWRATCTTRWPRPCTASGSPRWRSRAASRSTRRARSRTPASWPRTRAPRPRRRASC